MKRIIYILIAILIESSVDCFGQGQVTRLSKQQSQSGTQPSHARKQKKSTPKVKVSEPDGYINGHGFVDLGLSVKWATCNVGASTPERYGEYFAWGDTFSKKKYTKNNSLTCSKSMSILQSEGIINSYGILNKKYDVASANWGESWRMPTESEFYELVEKCKWEWILMDGKRGCQVTGPNGKIIFLPAAGRCFDSLYHEVGKYMNFWSASVCNGSDGAYSLYFHYLGNGKCHINFQAREDGLSVRAVTE